MGHGALTADAELMTELVRHLHAFARKTRLTNDEWMSAVDWLTRTGRISDAKRQEFILASDVLGLSSLVVALNHRFDERATPATVLGPFHIDGSPAAEFGFDMIDEARLRAKYRARPDGSYCVRTIAPLGYTIPMDGPSVT